MNCSEYQDHIPELLDGTIQPALRTAVESHIDMCPRCAYMLALHRTVFNALETAEPIKAPAGLADRILAAAEAETAYAPAPKPSIFRFLPAIPLTAAACVLGAILYFISNIMRTPAARVMSESFVSRLATVRYAPELFKAWISTMIATDWFASLTAPVTIPGMGFDLPVYYLAFSGIMTAMTAITAWIFFTTPVMAAHGMVYAGTKR